MHIPHDNGSRDPVIEHRLDLSPNQVVPVPTAAGTIVVCVKGSLWLTQEGEWRDLVLLEGMRFVSAGAGRIVISALDTASEALVYAPLPGAASSLQPGLHIDGATLERAARNARRLRAEALGQLFERALAAAKAFLRRVFDRARRPCEHCNS